MGLDRVPCNRLRLPIVVGQNAVPVVSPLRTPQARRHRSRAVARTKGPEARKGSFNAGDDAFSGGAGSDTGSPITGDRSARLAAVQSARSGPGVAVLLALLI